MSAHTPGPWAHHPEDNIIAAPDGRGLIEWQARSVHVSIEERDANARLIAAAPELLEALKGALAAWDRLYPSMPVNEAYEDCEFREMQRARAAIAKVTVSQP